MTVHETKSWLISTGFPLNLHEAMRLPKEASQKIDAETTQILIDALPPKEQQVITMRYKEAMTMGQIAERLGIPYHVAKTTKERGLRYICQTKAFYRIMKEIFPLSSY